MWAPRTLVITDRRQLPGAQQDAPAAIVAFVRAVAAAGVDAVQVRERDWEDGQLLRVTRRACEAVRGTSCRVLVNERAHVAWAARADGVHLRATAMPVARLRALSPAHGRIIGRSVHVDDDAALAAGADYVLFGTVFASVSKGSGAPVAGLAPLAAWAARPGAPPVLGVGGIDVARCEAVRQAGAVGIAGIDLFARAYACGPAALTATVEAIHDVFRDGERAE
jgi:thiamine-phosphate pyrophosphorylase